jgi:hypothetical protein
MKLRVFCDVLPCSQIDVDRRFRGACCLHHILRMLNRSGNVYFNGVHSLQTRPFLFINLTGIGINLFKIRINCCKPNRTKNIGKILVYGGIN